MNMSLAVNPPAGRWFLYTSSGKLLLFDLHSETVPCPSADRHTCAIQDACTCLAQDLWNMQVSSVHPSKSFFTIRRNLYTASWGLISQIIAKIAALNTTFKVNSITSSKAGFAQCNQQAHTLNIVWYRRGQNQQAHILNTVW